MTFNSDGSPSDVQTKLIGCSNGDTVTIPSGTFNWTAGAVAQNIAANVTLKGLGGTGATGGGDGTIITDNFAGSSSQNLMNITSTGSLRFTGITVQSGTGTVKDGGTVVLGSTSLRIDHCHFIATSTNNYKMVTFYGGVRGVMDHCIVDLTGTNALYFFNGRSGGGGDQQANYEWTQPTSFGSSDYFFIEDSIINGNVGGGAYSTRIFDGATGSKIVVRFNTVSQASLGETHATGHSPDDRSLRSQEVYGNSVTSSLAHDPNFVALDMDGGTALLWGNTWDQCYKNIYSFKVIRKDSGTYATSPTPTGWGYAGATPLATGTVNVTGTAVTWVSGAHFDTGWPAGSMIYIVGATAIGVSGQAPGAGPSCGIASVNSTTSITLANGGHTGSPLTGVAYTVGSAWDGNTDAVGYPCLDQLGRGSGDLLVGVKPNTLNNVTGTVHWPNQPLEPVYIWNNSGAIVAGWGGSTYSDQSAGRIVSDRDYYKPASGIQTNATNPFNGTTGCGWGTLANRPTTCTKGVAYFATDQGSWNTSVSNPQGVQQNGASGLLYVATATNTWTLYYTPYTYPHPLQAPSGAPVVNSSGSASGTVGIAFSYQITATNSPLSFGASSLPAGLSVNTFTGLISGTPTTQGVSSSTVSATNASGTGNMGVTITIGIISPGKGKRIIVGRRR